MRRRSSLKVWLEALVPWEVELGNGSKRIYQPGDVLDVSFPVWLALEQGRRQRGEEPLGERLRVLEVELEGEPAYTVTRADPSSPGRPPEARVLATEFLLELLKGVPVAVREGVALAGELGISEATLRRARESLGIKSRRRGFGPGSVVYWLLPEGGKTESEKEG